MKRSYKINERWYLGCKTSLLEWIFETIDEECEGCCSFFDVFAGTGVVSHKAMEKYDKVIVNDFLFSNNIFHIAFFEDSHWNETIINQLIEHYNSINQNNLPNNYFSDNFGNKYFLETTAKFIGYVREDLERQLQDGNINYKEFCILLTSLVYSVDFHPNTVGHFDAFLKRKFKYDKVVLNPIDVLKVKGEVEIHREDSNILAKGVKCDIAYLDPPYNSRQYSRLYHVYETLVKWDKPVLSGVTMKPPIENKSVYSTSRAKEAFRELIRNLDVKYIVVSYNNNFKEDGKTSRNKMSFDEIKNILDERGETTCFYKPYKVFTTGKTKIENNQEILFITKIL